MNAPKPVAIDPGMTAFGERRHASGRPPAPLCSELPSTAQLLVSGGDARIALTQPSLANRYGCGPFPDETLVALGSSTASVISHAGFAAADRLREQILTVAPKERWSAIYAVELQRVRRALSHACGVSELSGVEIVFAASGTDLHLVAAQLTGGDAAARTLAVTVDGSETGSSVPTALAGRHFSTRATFCEHVNEGALLVASRMLEVATVSLRRPDTTPLPAALVDAEVEALVGRAAATGQRVLLVVVDVSKTGLLAPSLPCVARLQRRFPDNLEVMVDACQFRIAPATVRAYLERDCMVALTGSKFVTGPAFCGALLLGPGAAQRLRARPLPASLRDYCARADWPDEWSVGSRLEPVDNFGLLLRWEAALQELNAFRAVPDSQIAMFLYAFAEAIRGRLANHPAFEPLLVPEIERSGLSEAGWDRVQTIFPFLLRRANGVFLNREQTANVYQRLQHGLASQPASPGRESETAAIRCQLGQPVACGHRDGVPVSALRLCASARMVVTATKRGGADRARVIAQALRALDKTAWLATNGS